MKTQDQPSNTWKFLNSQIENDMKKYGDDNFKQTAALSYFTWTEGINSPHFQNLIRKTDKLLLISFALDSLLFPADCGIMKAKKGMTGWKAMIFNEYYTFYTHLIWNYSGAWSCLLSEPTMGNPPRVINEGQLISQDLANSAMEYKTIQENTDFGKVKRITEIGAGYGRLAWLIVKLNPKIEYTIIDIQPTLGIAKRYLKKTIPRGKFTFLEPKDMKKAKKADLFINISSFPEMNRQQVEEYFDYMNVPGAFIYIKEYLKYTSEHDSMRMNEEDYPAKKNWKVVARKNCEIHSNFFEKIWKVEK